MPDNVYSFEIEVPVVMTLPVRVMAGTMKQAKKEALLKVQGEILGLRSGNFINKIIPQMGVAKFLEARRDS